VEKHEKTPSFAPGAATGLAAAHHQSSEWLDVKGEDDI
jgi:hypothetical protein